MRCAITQIRTTITALVKIYIACLSELEKKGFEKKKNADLWKRFLTVYRHHNVKMAWIEAHAGHHYNERCDQLAKKAASQGPWQVDVAYEDLVSTSSL